MHDSFESTTSLSAAPRVALDRGLPPRDAMGHFRGAAWGWTLAVLLSIAVALAACPGPAAAGLPSASSAKLVTLAGRLLDRPGTTFAGIRVVTAMTATVVASQALRPPGGQSTSGRMAGVPDVPGLDGGAFRAGTAAAAFAGAMALDRETHSRWVRWVAYPAAGLVGWSLARGDRDGGLDILGGAALGMLMAGRVENLTHPSGVRSNLRPIVNTHRQSIRLGARLTF